MELMQVDDIIRILIPSDYASVVEPCDVGINKSIKDLLKRQTPEWRRQSY